MSQNQYVYRAQAAYTIYAVQIPSQSVRNWWRFEQPS